MLNKFLQVLRLLLGLTIITLSLTIGFARAANADDEAASYRRVLITENDDTFYVVGPRAPTLFMISRDLYGNERAWGEIAEWNEMKAPYIIEIGQRLLLKRPPTNSEAEGNITLIRAWSTLGKIEVVEKIGQSQKQELAAVPPAAVEAESPAANPETKTEPNSEIKTETKVVTKTSVEIKEVGALKAHEIEHKKAAKPKSEEATEEHERNWSLGVAGVVSVSRIDNNFVTQNVHDTLSSKVDLGVDADLRLRLGHRFAVLFNGAFEKLDIKKPNSGEVEGETQNLSHYAVGLDFNVDGPLHLVLSGIYDQEAFGRPTPEGASVTTFYVPQVSIGAHLMFYETRHFDAEFQADGLILLPAKHEEFDLKTGYGFVAGLNFASKFHFGAITYGPAYRYLQQNSADIKNNQRAGFFKLGIEL